MKNKRIHFIACLFFVCSICLTQVNSFSQDSSHIRISLLTCTPGEELYSTFGHTAIRVTDSSSVSDIVFNYGTFNFEDPGFYMKFIRGKLLYYLSAEKFEDFKSAYQYENRGITEQLLNLSGEDKITIMRALYENIKPANATYKYDFFFDNCTTRPRDLLLKYKHNTPTFKPVMPAGTRFRQAIHQYLDINQKDWSKLGIDILLGAPTDAVMTTAQSQFIPDNLMKTLDSSNTDNQWILTHTNLYDLEKAPAGTVIFTPLVCFSLFALFIFLLSFSSNNIIKNFLQGFDGIFFFLVGVMGILLIFMWTSTDHSMCKNNFNLLWAWPTHTVMAFLAYSNKSWARKYFGFTAIALNILLVAWYFLPQQLNYSLIPLLLLLIFRSYQRAV